MRTISKYIILILVILAASLQLIADPLIEKATAQSYQYDPDSSAAVSPKAGWQQFPPELEEREWWMDALLWFPNRLLDFIDIFRVDVGVGSAYGASIKITEHGQAAYRKMVPFSVRVGAFGRQAPIMVETSDEIGIGSYMQKSLDRQVCPGEVGVGGDLLLVGAYGGICLDEFGDFLAGLFFFDLMDDDF